jgi:aldose 1-epimerase
MKLIPFVFSLFLLGYGLSSCHQSPENNREVVVSENGNKKYFGIIGSDTVYAYTLNNKRGLKVVITNYGATLLELWTPDKAGNSGDGEHQGQP